MNKRRLAADLLARLRSLLRRRQEDDETAEELRFHLEMEAEKNVRAGMDPRQARRQARVRLGGVDGIREAVRDARGGRPLEDLVRDLGYALRSARRNPGFTLVAVLTLTLGIGANTAVFTVVDNFLFRPPPFEHVDRLMSIRDVNPAQGWTVEDNVAGSPGNFLDWRAQSRSFDHLIALAQLVLLRRGTGGPQPHPRADPGRPDLAVVLHDAGRAGGPWPHLRAGGGTARKRAGRHPDRWVVAATLRRRPGHRR